jgi:hypothetical protein
MIDRVKLTPGEVPDNEDTANPADAALKTEQDRIAAQKEQFGVEQEARAKMFARDQEAMSRRMERDHDVAQATLEENAKRAAAQRENDEKAFEDGIITHDDLLHRQELLAPHHDCILPWQATAEGEPTVKMAFPRTTILTRSASDIYGQTWKDDEESGDKAPARDDGRDFPLGIVAHRSAITPVTPNTRVIFQKGYQDVPVSLADHAYLYASGAYRIGDDGKPEKADARNKRLAGKPGDKPVASGKFSKAPARAAPDDDEMDYTDDPHTAPVGGKPRFPAGKSG